MKNDIYRTLEKFGLTKNEIIIYLEALKHEEVLPYQISKATGIARTTVYDVMLNLSLKGLIELQQNQGFEKQQTRIRAKNPSTLRSIIREKQEQLTKLEVDMVDIIPQLKLDFHQHQTNTDFQFLPGIAGAKQVLDSVTEALTKLPVYVFNYLMPMDAFGKKYINQSVNEELLIKAHLKVSAKNLIPLNKWTKHVLTYQYGRDKKYLQYNEFRYIDNPIFNLYQEIYLINNTVKIISTEEDEIWGLSIKSKSLAKSLKSVFLVLWQTAQPITVELIRSWGENAFLKAERELDSR